jgi:Fe2+ transport system protein FeoA
MANVKRQMSGWMARSDLTAGLARDGVVALSEVRAGERGVVAALDGGRGLLSRMASLGFTPGAEVTVVQNFRRGPLIAQVRGARIALGRGEAAQVKVHRESQ